MTLKTPIYLDHHATTPVDPRVIERLTDVLRNHFGNPASTTHAFGWAAARLVETAREEVAALIGATAREVVFTAGATESINLALRGVAARYGERGDHLVTTNVEHEAVTNTLRELAGEGWRITTVPVDRDGRVDPDHLAAQLTEQTVLVSVIAAQNEIGTLQPVRRIGALCKERGVLLHVDAAQAVGKVPVDVIADGIDLLSLSGHKLYAPKGVGALYVRRRDPRVTLSAQLAGGGQERGLRSGTLNVPGIVGLGEACRVAREDLPAESRRLAGLRDRMWKRISDELTDVTLNGSLAHRLPGNLNLSFAGVLGHRLLGALTVLAVSSGSACASTESAASVILTAIGVPDDLARASLRIGLGRGNTEEEADFAAEKIIAAVKALRRENAEL